ncbi:MAG: TonB-dependent receptor [Tannerellaceae bacterium]|nr:TonB-dependent receptor [Tannerellaceae bacterium]
MKICKSSPLRIWITLLLGLLCTQVQYAQPGSEVLIEGKIVDTNHLEIVGAVIKVQNRPVGTATDIDGLFSLHARVGETLEISYIGYKKQFLRVTTARKDLVITLEEESIELENVVVVGYGTTRKEKLTGAVATVSTADFKNRPLNDVSLALQGKVPGVQVTQNSGQPGADGGAITVRGIGTLNDSSPLIIIDGFESSFDKVDPKDIESMTVLKDAASAAIYGNKAANGVILITTRKGRSGKLAIEYNGYFSMQSVTRYPSLLGSVDYMELYNEARANSGLQPAYSEEYIDHFRNGENPALYPDRDWADFYFKPAAQHNHYLKMNGGSDHLAYSLSIGYLNQDGILSGTEYSKYTFRSNINSSHFNDRLKIATNIAGYSGTQVDLVNGTGSTLARIIQMNPMVNAKMEGYGWTGWFYDDAVKEAGGYNNTETKNFNGNINLQLQITPQLKLEGAVNYDRTHQFGKLYAPNVTLYTIETGSNGEQTIGENQSVESQIRESTYEFGNISTFATLSYWINVKEDHHFKLLAGGQQAEWDNRYYQTERKRLTADLPTLEVGDPATQKNAGWASEVRTLSLFGRFNYDYKDKYIFEANIRYDGSSKFATGNKWGLFPSFSVGWRISEEPFLRNAVSWINELKLRASWGQLGNEKIWSAYAGIDILSVGSANYIWNNQSTTGSALSYISNKDLTWETTTQQNVGLDITVFNALTLNADFYIKETDNILMQLPVSSTFGFSETPWQNAGKMRNVGAEFLFSYYQPVTKELELNGSVSLSFNKNKILDLKGQSPILQSTNGILLEEGRPINTLYGYEIEGIYQSEEEIRNHLVTFDRYGNPVNSYSGLVAAPGDIRFKDQNGDGMIDMDNDRVALGDPNPDMLYSFSVGARYKGFDFTAFFQGVLGGKGWSSGELVSPFFNSYNSAGWMVDRWTPEKPNNTYQRVFLDSQRSSIKSAYYVEDLSYMRLKNIEIGYTVPASFLQKIRLTGARIFVSGQNLFTLTSYKGFDPERAGVNSTNIYDYPLVKTFTTGINLTF